MLRTGPTAWPSNHLAKTLKCKPQSEGLKPFPPEVYFYSINGAEDPTEKEIYAQFKGGMRLHHYAIQVSLTLLCVHKIAANFSLATIWYPFPKILLCMRGRSELTIKQVTILTKTLFSYIMFMKELISNRRATLKTARGQATGSGKRKKFRLHSLPQPNSLVTRFKSRFIPSHYVTYCTCRIITSPTFATFQILGAFAKLWKVTISFVTCLSVCLPERVE
jgi:hypothetical protein